MKNTSPIATKQPGDLLKKFNEGKTKSMVGAYKKISKKEESKKHEKGESKKKEKKEESKMKKSSPIKKTGKFEGKSNKLGGGGRFAQVVEKVKGKKGVKNAKALAAYIGRKSLGKAKFQKLAAKGKKRA
jgi:hypothetical protein